MWQDLKLKFKIDLKKTLFSGQVFNFKEIESGIFAGNIYNYLCVLKQQDDKILFLDTSPDIEKFIRIFFNTDLEIEHLPDSKGLRFLTNDFYPTVFSFICSSNNNLKRITKLVNYLYSKGLELKLNKEYMIEKYGGNAMLDPFIIELLKHSFYKFPELKDLVSIENELNTQKFGYRSKFICESARRLLEQKNEIDWAALSYEEAKKNLISLSGIGRKVADCICLISLKFFHVVPLDTHIFRISKNEFQMQSKTLNDKLYFQIQQLWVEKYGKYAGIIQLYKFKESLDSQPGRKQGK